MIGKTNAAGGGTTTGAAIETVSVTLYLLRAYYTNASFETVLSESSPDYEPVLVEVLKGSIIYTLTPIDVTTLSKIGSYAVIANKSGFIHPNMSGG